MLYLPEITQNNFKLSGYMWDQYHQDFFSIFL
jgi:hypothetical protein